MIKYSIHTPIGDVHVLTKTEGKKGMIDTDSYLRIRRPIMGKIIRAKKEYTLREEALSRN